jgi:bla regulator protein blaR1
MSAWIWDTLLVTSLLVIAVLAIRRPVAMIFGPSVAYWLWMLPAARLLMPPMERETIIPANAVSNDALTGPIALAQSTASGAGIGADLGMAATSGIDWMQLAVIIWIAGAAFLFIAQNLRYVSMRDALLADANPLGRAGGIQLIESDQVGGPLAFGLFKRYIVVPENFTTQFSAEERELALAHEMAHHKSGDLFANLAAFIVLCLTWFNPFSWLAWNAFRFDQEAACDARVLAGRDAKAKEVYGRTLARAAHAKLPQARIANDRVPTFATALNSPKTIIARLRNLNMRDISKNRRLFGKLGILAAVGVTLPLTATIVTVPVAARDQTVTITRDNGKKTKTEIIVGGNEIDLIGDKDTPFVQTIEHNGKVVILRTSKKLSDAEAKIMVTEAEASRAEADAARDEAESSRAQADAWGEKTKQRDGAAWSDKEDHMSSILDHVRTAQVKSSCTKSSVSSSHEHNKRITVAVSESCIKDKLRHNISRISERAALQGLRSAREAISDERNLSRQIQQQVQNELDREIGQVESRLRRILITPQPPAAPQPPEPPENPDIS